MTTKTVYRRGFKGHVGIAEPISPNAVMARSGRPCVVEFDDKGPDEEGRRRFSLTWDQPFGQDFERRAQHFFAVPSNHFQET